MASERKIVLEKKGTQTALNKINKYVKPSIDKVGKVSKRLGYIGAAYNTGTLVYDIVKGEEITEGQVFDTALAVGLTFIAISNPVALVGLGIYTVLDMTGSLDGIKNDLGMNTVIMNKK